MWGNAGRNTIAGPMLVSLNASAGRVFRLESGAVSTCKCGRTTR